MSEDRSSEDIIEDVKRLVEHGSIIFLEACELRKRLAENSEGLSSRLKSLEKELFKKCRESAKQHFDNCLEAYGHMSHELQVSLEKESG